MKNSKVHLKKLMAEQKNENERKTQYLLDILEKRAYKSCSKIDFNETY